MSNKVAVVGIGNVALKDEGAGIHALRLLRQNHPEIGADLIEAGTPGFGLYDLMGKYGKVIFLDAVNMGRPAGTVGEFSADQLVASMKSFSLHEIGLAEVIKLGKEMGNTFSHVTVLGIQPQTIAYGEELSENVRQNLPHLVAHVVKEVNHGTNHAGDS